MKNTLENKVKYFAQYWGQRVMGMKIDETPEIEVSYIHESTIKDWVLILTPLSNITDEHLNYIANFIIGVGDETEKVKDLIEAVRTDNYIHAIQMERITTGEIIELSQYLASKGYAVPFMRLSVGNLIEYGWLKLN